MSFEITIKTKVQGNAFCNSDKYKKPCIYFDDITVDPDARCVLFDRKLKIHWHTVNYLKCRKCINACNKGRHINDR